jgi:tight adherence protein B
VNPLFVTTLTFLAVVMAIFGIYSVFADLYLRDRSRVGRRMEEEFRKRQRERVRKSALFKDISKLAAEAAEEEGALSWRERFIAMVEQSGLETTPQKVLSIAAIAGLVVGFLVLVISMNVLVALPAALIGASLPLFYVRIKWRKRLSKLLEQLPEAFDLMGRVIRAGQTMAQALQAVADEFDPPIAVEFAYCYEQQNLGLAPEISLRDLARRTGLLELKIFVLAVLVQQQTGGNLAELLDNLSKVVRERSQMKGKIRALTAEGRLQATVLLGLPPGMLLLLLILNYDYARLLFENPGYYWLGGMFVMEFIGALWIRKVVNFDF